MFGYYDYYMSPAFDYTIILVAAAAIAAVLGCVLFFTFLRRSNEVKYRGFRRKLYNLLTFNKFYTEKIVEFVYIIAAAVATVTGIVMICMGIFTLGIFLLVVVNILLRVAAELLLMFIIFCRKTVSIDRRLADIEEKLAACGDCEEEDEYDFGAAYEKYSAEMDCEFDAAGCMGCNGYDCCSDAADEICSQCENWSDAEGGCVCPDDCETCDKDFVDEEDLTEDREEQ